MNLCTLSPLAPLTEEVWALVLSVPSPIPTPGLPVDSLTPPCGPLGEGVLELGMTDGSKEPREETGVAQIPRQDPSGKGGWWVG